MFENLLLRIVLGRKKVKGMFKKIKDALEGKKTVIISALAVLATAGNHMGWINDTMLQQVYELAKWGAASTMALKINRLIGKKSTQ